VERWIVGARIQQGDTALARGNVRDAELSYQLALRIDPENERARSGFVAAAVDLAQAEYERGNFEDALATLNEAARYDPTNVRIQALRTTLEQARLDREIVISNYPTYNLTGQQIQKSFEALVVTDTSILRDLRHFQNTYDTQHLTHAIKNAYDLQLEVNRNLNRLIAYRQLVESGIPTHSATSGTPGGSLLPLP
jgi:tetratricopeptide (TPR) repeat protein